MISDETFFAWLDGELEPAEAGRIAALVAVDPALSRKAEAHRALGARLNAAFAPIAAAPVPKPIAEAARPRGAEIVDFAARRAAARPAWAPMQYAAMAATLAIGVVAGSMLNNAPSGPIAADDGQLVASGDLDRALSTRLASAPEQQGARIGLTFRDAAGDLCRSFTDGGASGLACRRDGNWRIRGLFQAGEGQQGQFRMAAGPDPRLAELIGSAMAGEPLDAAQEREALRQLR